MSAFRTAARIIFEEDILSALTDQQQKDLFTRVDYHIPTWIAEIKAQLAEVRSYVRPGNDWRVQDGWLQGALSTTNTQLPAARDELAELSAKVDRLSEIVSRLANPNL